MPEFKRVIAIVTDFSPRLQAVCRLRVVDPAKRAGGFLNLKRIHPLILVHRDSHLDTVHK